MRVTLLHKCANKANLSVIFEDVPFYCSLQEQLIICLQVCVGSEFPIERTLGMCFPRTHSLNPVLSVFRSPKPACIWLYPKISYLHPL